jgi:hypothetical protein
MITRKGRRRLRTGLIQRQSHTARSPLAGARTSEEEAVPLSGNSETVSHFRTSTRFLLRCRWRKSALLKSESLVLRRLSIFFREMRMCFMRAHWDRSRVRTSGHTRERALAIAGELPRRRDSRHPLQAVPVQGLIDKVTRDDQASSQVPEVQGAHRTVQGMLVPYSFSQSVRAGHQAPRGQVSNP